MRGKVVAAQGLGCKYCQESPLLHIPHQPLPLASPCLSPFSHLPLPPTPPTNPPHPLTPHPQHTNSIPDTNQEQM